MSTNWTCKKTLCNGKLRQLYDSGTPYETLNNDDLFNNQEKDPCDNQTYQPIRWTFFLETQKYHRQSIQNSQDDTYKDNMFSSDSEKGEESNNETNKQANIEDTNDYRHNVENMDENISGKNNVDISDKNISGEDVGANGAANQHSHSGGKGLYSYGTQNFDDENSDNVIFCVCEMLQVISHDLI